MTDQRLRDLERDAAHGDLQAQVRLPLERVRVGDLTEERLRLAAYLGDEVACLALGDVPRLLVTMDAEWFRCLIPWSPALAVWALAEACTVERQPEWEHRLDEVRVGLRAAFLAGNTTEFARSQSQPDLAELCATATGKALVLWLACLARDCRRSPADDPEVRRAVENVRSRFSSNELGEVTYAWSELEHDGTWLHQLRHVRRSGVESMTTAGASAGWRPDADAAPAGPGSLYDLDFVFSVPEAARTAVRAALLPWALAPSRSST